MNIEFEKIEVQNFKSIGEMISFDYREFKGLNFVYGKNLDMPNAKNGSGKTNLLIDALMFALIGKTLKNTNNNMTFSWNINEGITSSMAADHYKVIVEDVKGKTVSAGTEAINFYNPMYYGVVNSNVGIENITESIVLAFNGKIIEAKGNKIVPFTTSAERMVFAYPKEYGLLSSIIDPNGFNIINSVDVVTLTIKNVEYYVYMNNANTNTNFELEFIF
jgi:hypothetical protein